MDDRGAVLKAITTQLGSRDLYWGGLRSDDIEAISDLPNLVGAFSIVGGYERGGAVPSLDFEDLSGERVDVDAWDLDDHLGSPAAREYREAILHRLSGKCALLPYRPTRFLSSVAFARQDRCRNLGLFGDHQALFEHKPWVESNVAHVLGIPCVPWTYVADEEHAKVRRMVHHGPVMLRTSRSSGGAGLVRVDDPADVAEAWPTQPDAFASVAPLLENALPVNVGATVWQDDVTVSHPSVQLIGIAECTHRPFGYCGNDFGAAREIEPEVLDAIDDSVRRIGAWMRAHGYLGTFGVDFLVHEGRPLFAEVNARFQGSTQASSQISGERDESCVLLDHLAAFLGVDPPARPTLRDLAASVPDLGHVVVHHLGETGSAIDARGAVARLRALPEVRRIDVVAKPSIVTRPGGVVLRATVSERLTTTGFDLTQLLRSAIRQVHEQLNEEVS